MPVIIEVPEGKWLSLSRLRGSLLWGYGANGQGSRGGAHVSFPVGGWRFGRRGPGFAAERLFGWSSSGQGPGGSRGRFCDEAMRVSAQPCSGRVWFRAAIGKSSVAGFVGGAGREVQGVKRILWYSCGRRRGGADRHRVPVALRKITRLKMAASSPGCACAGGGSGRFSLYVAVGTGREAQTLPRGPALRVRWRRVTVHVAATIAPPLTATPTGPLEPLQCQPPPGGRDRHHGSTS